MPKGSQYREEPCMVKAFVHCPCGWQALALAGKAKALSRAHTKLCKVAQTVCTFEPSDDIAIVSRQVDTGKWVDGFAGKPPKRDPDDIFRGARG
jgi:hypothetical protein